MSERFKQRSKRSGIIAVSSAAAEAQFSMPKAFTYAATKIFVKYLCWIYDWENINANRQIDTLCLQPAYVKTKMIKPAEEEGRAFMVIPVEDCVSAALRDLGHENNTFGPIKHEFCG